MATTKSVHGATKTVVKKVVKTVVKKVVKKVINIMPKPYPVPPDHGKYIFIYNNLLSNRVLYSLSRTLDNRDSLRQLTFVGKKSVPAALRKDVWAPMATVTFKESLMGINTFRMLREFRHLHETSYSKELLQKPKKERTRILMNQKANSVADLAESIRMEVDRIRKVANPPPLRKGEKAKKDPPIKLPIPQEGDVVVKWSNIYDAQYAKVWPEVVVHGNLQRDGRHTAPVEGGKGVRGGARTVQEIKEAKKGIVNEIMASRAKSAKETTNIVL
ncbi:transcriptional regulation of mitochondrial recombination-domain-containing protein, partial [Tuber indicum]